MNVRGDTRYGIPGYPSSTYPQQDQYSYGSNAKPSTGHNFTAVRYPYRVSEESSIGPCRAIRPSNPYQHSKYAGCPDQKRSHPSRQSSTTNWIPPTNKPYTGMDYQYGRNCPNVTVRNHCPQRTGSHRLPFPGPLVSSNKTPTRCYQKALQSSARPFHISQYVQSPLKRFAECCDSDPIPLKRQCMDQNAIPYSVQLNGYQKGLHIQGNCFLTVTKDTEHQNSYLARGPPSNIDNANSASASSLHHPNSHRAICELPNQPVLRTSRETFSPYYNSCSPDLRSFPYASNGFAQHGGDPSSSKRPCTFLSESEFRDQPCGNVNKNLPVIENKTPPSAVENLLPHPRVSYSRDPPNYDKLHLNPISENCSNQTQDGYSCLPKNNRRLHEICTRQHQTPNNLSLKAIPSHCAMGDRNFKQHAVSFMKLPEAVASQQFRNYFSPKPDISSNITKHLQSPVVDVLPTKLRTIDPFEATSRSKITNNISPLIPPPKTNKHTDVFAIKLPNAYPPPTTSESKSLKDYSTVIPKPKVITSKEKSYVQKLNTRVFPSELSSVEPPEAKVIQYNCAVNPEFKEVKSEEETLVQERDSGVCPSTLPSVPSSEALQYNCARNPKAVKSQEEWLVQKPEDICSKSYDATGSENADINCFKVQHPKDESVKASPGSTSISYTNISSVKHESGNFAANNNQSPNSSKSLTELSLSVKAECVIIDESDQNGDINCFKVQPPKDESVKALHGSTTIFDISGSSVRQKSGYFAVDTNQPQNTSESQRGHSMTVKEECIIIDDIDDDTGVIILDDEIEDSTATKTPPKISSDFIVGGTTFAAFTIDGDELEMTTQELGIEMLDIFMKSE